MGFINGTLLPSSTLTIDALHKHEPRGATLAIHSVVIDPLLRQRGLGAAMLQHYMQRLIKHFPAVKETVLMAKVAKLGFYQRCGFRLIGPSDLVHGQEKWYELRRAHHQMD